MPAPAPASFCDHDAVTARGELAHRRGHQADAVLVVFDFLGNSDAASDRPWSAVQPSTGSVADDLDSEAGKARRR